MLRGKFSNIGKNSPAQARPGLLPREGQKAHHPGTFHGPRDLALVFGAKTGMTRVDYFTLARNKTLQGLRLPEIYYLRVLRAEKALFWFDWHNYL